MKITNLEETIAVLRTKLPDYLKKKGILHDERSRFNCFLHDDTHPSMGLNPKANFEVAVCFACNQSADIFKAAQELDSLPMGGAEWITETIPTLAEYLEVPISLGEPSEHERMRAKLYALARDIADLMTHPANANTKYMEQRGWVNDFEDCFTVDYEEIMSALLAKGWSREYITSTKMINITSPIIGSKQATFVIRDHRGRAVAFISRQLTPGADPKYIHSGESPIYIKRDILYGLDLALKDKQKPLWVVEGSGDRFALLSHGITNVVALCGVAFTDSHLNHLKLLGVRDLYLCLDWDNAGTTAIRRLVDLLNTKKISGFNIHVVQRPATSSHKDIDEFLASGGELTSLQLIELFDWLVQDTNLQDPLAINKQLIPAIAAAPTAIQRDMLARKLSALTGLQVASILSDVDKIRNRTAQIRQERIQASADKYRAAIELDPDNIQAAISLHEQEITDIDNEFGKDSFGVNYQLSRFDSLQTIKSDTEVDRSAFTLSKYTYFAMAMSDGMAWTSGTYILWGGRPNASKTACCLAIMLDAVLSDPDCMVIGHLTDDAYKVVEPRLVTNIAYLQSGKQLLTIGEAAAPRRGFKTPEHSALYTQAITTLRGLLSEERLTVLDSEDGSNLSVLERTIKYLRRKYPNRKLLVVCDGVHNYSDFPHLDQTARIARIADGQKRLSVKYDCCVFSTGEYRKSSGPVDTTKVKLPINDDLADSRAIAFRASVIVHVYNDLNDRGIDCADTVWMKKGQACPRLVLIFGKNKVTKFKDKLVLDLDPDTVTLKQVSASEAAREYSQLSEDSEDTIDYDKQSYNRKTDWDDEDE